MVIALNLDETVEGRRRTRRRNGNRWKFPSRQRDQLRPRDRTGKNPSRKLRSVNKTVTVASRFNSIIGRYLKANISRLSMISRSFFNWVNNRDNPLNKISLHWI